MYNFRASVQFYRVDYAWQRGKVCQRQIEAW
jgi:hypothetical protein